MPLPRSFKTDESFLEKIAIGATGTRQAFADLLRQGHQPLELERGSQSFKIWKAIKIKRIRLPDILCLHCAHRVESRAKTSMEITMSHSVSLPERGWDYGLDDEDRVALIYCQRNGPEPIDWHASPVVQYIPVQALRQTWLADQVKTERPKGAQEGFETRVTWPAAVASAQGLVEQITSDTLRYRKTDGGRSVTIQLRRKAGKLTPVVAPSDSLAPGQIIAAIVPVTTTWPCPGGAGQQTYIQLAASASLSDRYTAVKALGRFPDPAATAVLVQRTQDPREQIYVRMDAAAGLMRRGHPDGQAFLSAALQDTYLATRLEATIVLSEVATPEAVRLLTTTLQNSDQDPEIRAGAAWSLGEIGAGPALPVLVQSFNALDLIVKVEATRALAKLARTHHDDILQIFSKSTPECHLSGYTAPGSLGHHAPPVFSHRAPPVFTQGAPGACLLAELLLFAYPLDHHFVAVREDHRHGWQET